MEIIIDSGRSSGASDADRDKDEVIEHLRMENDRKYSFDSKTDNILLPRPA